MISRMPQPNMTPGSVFEPRVGDPAGGVALVRVGDIELLDFVLAEPGVPVHGFHPDRAPERAVVDDIEREPGVHEGARASVRAEPRARHGIG